MSNSGPGTNALETALAAREKVRYRFRLYVAGNTPHSARAIVNLRKICEEHLAGRYDLEVMDLAENPALAEEEQIIAAPTLLKMLPLPRRRFIGDLSQTARILAGLEIPSAPAH